VIAPVLRSGTQTRKRAGCHRIASTLLLLALPWGAAVLSAQQRSPAADSAAADSASRDSIAARLRRAEAAIELLRQQLAVEASTVVRTRSRLQIELSARILMNGFLTSNRVNNVDVPQFGLPMAAVPPTLPGSTPPGSPGTRALGMSVRQSRLGAALSVDSVLGGVFEGDIDLDFFGGVSTGPGDRRLFPEPRLRTARARLRWDRGSVLIGSETPLISDLNPVSFASVGVPGFVAAGNLWNWLPQIRVSRDLLVTAAGVRVGLQGALLAPFANTLNSAENDAVDAGERSGRPYVQGRVNIRWGEDASESGAPSDVSLGGSGGELGVGIHRGWVRAAGDSTSISRALSVDGRVMIAPRVEIRGEAYRGQLVRGLGGGGIGQGFGRSLTGGTVGPPLRDVAGWVQLNVQAHTTLISGAGCGKNSVNRDDRPIRLENTACAAHLMWRPAQPLVLGMEFRQVRTRYSDQVSRANHVNLSFGFEL
jgi:hypothetical protein